MTDDQVRALREQMFAAGRFIATRRGPGAPEATRAIADAMSGVERLAWALTQERERKEAALDFERRAWRHLMRHRTAAEFYAMRAEIAEAVAHQAAIEAGWEPAPRLRPC